MLYLHLILIFFFTLLLLNTAEKSLVKVLVDCMVDGKEYIDANMASSVYMYTW